jgi:hypothetical protein
VASRWFSPGTLVFSINKINRHDITEILLEVALNTITLTLLIFAVSIKQRNLVLKEKHK